MSEQYVILDKITQSVSLQLPESCYQYESVILKQVYEEFAMEPLNKQTIQLMNQFVINWLLEKGVDLSVNKDNT